MGHQPLPPTPLACRSLRGRWLGSWLQADAKTVVAALARSLERGQDTSSPAPPARSTGRLYVSALGLTTGGDQQNMHHAGHAHANQKSHDRSQCDRSHGEPRPCTAHAENIRSSMVAGIAGRITAFLLNSARVRAARLTLTIAPSPCSGALRNRSGITDRCC